MNPSHQKKIEKLAKHLDAKQTELPDSELLVSLIDIEDKLDEQKKCMDEMMEKEVPDHTDKLETLHRDIMDKLNEEIIVSLKII